MREIKFRAWDKENKTFISYTKLRLHWLNTLMENSISNYEWNQLTGLKDKNGKEIYEGDLVKWCVWNDCQKNTEREWHEAEEVYWDEKLARFTTKSMIMNMIFSPFQYEAIGNIYENPELLAEPKNEYGE